MSTPTAGGDSNLDNIIKKNFPTEIQQRRVKLELKYLKELDQSCYKISLQSSPLGLKIIVSLTKDFILGQLPQSKKFQHPIMFEFLLEPKFPFVFPKLLCKTNITTPSLADGRDFVYDVIQRMWNPSIMLRDVVTFIPDFLKKIDELQVPEETQTMGSYYLGHLYNLEDFLSMDSVQVFSAKEMINEQSTNNERFLVLSESYFLNFESVDKVRNTLRLIGWAHVHAIFKIKRNKDDHKMIVVLWRDFNNKGILIQNVFIMEESTQFIEAFIRQSTKYADISDAIRKKRDLPLSEVTAKSYENMDIEQLLETIEILESKLEEELDIDTINLLMNLYQKAVEYFSALNDETYSIFMEKLHVLLTREDIQIVLKSGESMPAKPQSPQKSPQKKPETKAPAQTQKQEPVTVQPVTQVQEVKKEEAPKPVEQKVQEEVKPKEEEEQPKVAEKKEEPVVVEPEPVQKEEEKPKEPEPEVKQAEPEQKEEEKASEVSQPETQEAEKPEESQSKKSKKSKNKKGKAAAEEPQVEEVRVEESKPEEPKPEEVQSEEPKVEEQKPEETKPEEPKAEEKPEEIQPEEPKVEEQKPEETKPEEAQTEETKPEEPKVEEKIEESQPEEPKAEEAQPAEEAKVEETQAEEPKAEESNPEESKAEETKPEEVQTEETKPEEPKVEEKPEESQPEEPKTEEAKPEEPKVEEKKEEEETTSHANVAIANNDDMFDIGDDDDD